MFLRTRYYSNLFYWFKKSTALIVVFSLLISTLLTPFAYSRNISTEHKLRSASKFLNTGNQNEYKGIDQADIESNIRTVSEQLNEPDQELNVAFFRNEKKENLKPLNLLQGVHEWVKGRKQEWKKDWRKWWLWNFLYYTTSPISGAPNSETPLVLGLVLAANHFLIFALLSDPVGRVLTQVALLFALSGILALLHGDLFSNKQILNETPSFTGALKQLFQPFWQRAIGEIFLIAPILFLPFHIGFAVSWAIHFIWNLGVEVGWWHLPLLSFFGGMGRTSDEIFPVDRDGLMAPKTFDTILNSLGNLRKDQTQEIGEKSRAIPIEMSEEGNLFFKELFNLENSPRQAYLLTHSNGDKNEQRPYGIIILEEQPYFLNLSGLPLYREMNEDFNRLDQANLAAKILFAENFVSIERQTQVELKIESVAPDIGRNPYLYPSFGEPFQMITLSHDRVFSPRMGESIDYQQVLFQQRHLFPNKTVLEIGVGSGVGLLYALRFGAKAVSGTDISAVHALVARWNLKYAEETGQIPPIPEGAAKVIIGNGFASLPNHDLNLWNTPGISSQENIGQRMREDNKTMSHSFNIATEQFLPIFYELKERLNYSDSMALWRLLPYRDSGLVEESDQDILDDVTSLYLELNFVELFRDRAERFIRQESLSGELVSHALEDVSSNIYLLKAIKAVVSREEIDWTSKIRAIDHIRNAIAQNRPELIDRYDRLYEIENDENSVQKLREDIYGINSADFIVWGLGDVLNSVVVPHFQGDFRKALAAVFSDSRLKFSIHEMKRFGIALQQSKGKSKRGKRNQGKEGPRRGKGKQARGSDRSRASKRDIEPGISAGEELAQILERYKEFHSMEEGERRELRSELAKHLNIIEVPAQLEQALILEDIISVEIRRAWEELEESDRKVVVSRPMKIADYMNLEILRAKTGKKLLKRDAHPIVKYAMEFYGTELLKQLNDEPVEFTSEHPSDENLRERQVTVILKDELRKRFSKAKLNKRSLMGFVRDEHGRIQPVFSKSFQFESVRDIDPETVSLFEGWDGDREMQRVPLTLAEVEIKQMNTSFEWASLPSWLRDLFSAGKIFHTSSRTEGPYSVLMAVGQDHMSGRATGRSGVLLKDGLPVVLEIWGKEFIVEIKGVGAPEGGFGYKDSYLRGGAVVEESDLEYENLEAMRSRARFQNGFMPRALANAHFINQNNEVQGYLMRLSPGNVRASFNNNNAYDFMDKNEKVRKIAYEMGREIGEHLAEGFVPLSHVENLIVLNREFDCAFTDYYDVRPLHHFPFEYNHTTLDLYRAVRTSLHKFYEIEGFRENNGFQHAIEGLGNSLVKSGKISEQEKNHLLILTDHVEVALFLWAKFIAFDYYLAIRKHGLSLASKTYKKDYPSLKQIVQSAHRQYSDNKEAILQILQGKIGDWEGRIFKLERNNRLLEKSGFTSEGMVALMNSEGLKREFLKIINALEETLLWASDYIDVWNVWRDYTYELLANAAKLKKEIEFLRIVFDSSPAEFKDDVSMNIAIAQRNLTQLQQMTPYDYYLEIQKNRNFSKQVLKLPYHSKVKTKIDRTKKRRKQRDEGGIVFVIKDFVLTLFPQVSSKGYDFRIAPWLENLISYGLTYGSVYLFTGGNIHLASTISSQWGWGTFVILHLFNFVGKDGERGPPKEAATNLILSVMIASINLYFGFSPFSIESSLIHLSINLVASVIKNKFHLFDELPIKEAVSKVLQRADFKPRDLIRVLKRDPMLAKLYKAKTGVSEGYTLEQHTGMVLKQFEKYFGSIELPAGIDKRTFKLMLALHDIGKPIAFKENRVRDQHLYTREIIEKISGHLPLSEQQIALMLVLFEGDPIGMYLQKLISLEEAAEKIRTMADNTILPISQFFDLLTVYYQSDAASYTRDAGGKKALEYLFVRHDWQSSRFQFDRDQKRLFFSSSVETMFRELEMEVKKQQIFSSKGVKPKTAEEIKSKLFAVHATSVFPKEGILKAEAKESRGLADWESDDQPFFRPTLHFALGGLVRAAHELQPYAVVSPLKDLERQLINISANDTFILGDFQLSPDSYLLVPEGTELSSLDSNVKVRIYDPAKGLRRAVEQTITEQGGWTVKMYPGSVDVGSIAETEESEINSLQFFQDIVDLLPYLSVGVHARSEHGQAFRFGVIEFALQHLMLNYFGAKELQSKSTTNIKFLRSLILYHLPKLELWIKSLPLPPESIDLFDLKKEQLLRWLKIVDNDLAARQKFKRTISGSATWIQRAILKTKKNQKIVHILIKGLASILLLPKVKFSYGISPTYLAEWLSPMPPDELKELITLNQELFKETDLRQLYINYAIKRWVIIRAKRAKEEGLDKILSDSFEQLEENPPIQLEHLLRGLENYLTLSSNRVEDALELIRQPAVRHFLSKAYGIKFNEGSPKTLEEAGVLSTGMRRTKDFTHSSSASALDRDNDKQIKSDDSLQKLYEIWLKGKDSRDELIYEARKLGFDGLVLENYEEYALNGNSSPSISSALSKTNDDIHAIYKLGIKENIFQHAYGSGVYFWRESPDGYEYMSFDWGPGVFDQNLNPVENIRGIFGIGSYRKGATALRMMHKSGRGLGMTYLADASLFARAVSLNDGRTHVADKRVLGNFWRLSSDLPARQKNYNLPQEYKNSTGFSIHGFVPFLKQNYRGKLSPITAENILGTVQTKKSKQIYLGEWQKKPAQGLETLEPRDEVTFIYFDPELNEEGKQENRMTHRGILRSVPSETNQGVFIFEDGFTIGYEKVKEFVKDKSAFEIKLDKYFEDNNLTQYPELKKSFIPEVLEALLDDRSLRPVFMVVLEENKGQVGSLNVVNQKTLDKIGGEELLNSHSAFLSGMAGSADTAERMAMEGFKIIVGVTDDVMKPEDMPKNRDETYRFRSWNVANGRTVYFPLKDGTWLAVKGSGQNRGFGKMPYLLNRDLEASFYYEGIVSQDEARRAVEGHHLLKEKNGFIQLLGHRQIYQLPDGLGKFNNADQLDDSNGNPVNPTMVFYRVLTPHRLVKFSQLLHRDPNLLGLRKRISRALFSMGLISKGTVLSEEELINRIAKELGRTEAVKQNSGLFKESIHWQDFTFAGEEADLEELMTLEQYLEHLKQTPNHNEDEELLERYGLGIEGIMEKIMTLILMINSLDQEKKLFFPDGMEPLKIMMQEYFKNLEDEYIKAWMVEKWGELPRALVHIKNLSFEVFHSETADKANDRSLRKEVALLMYEWLKEEAGKRGIQTESQSNNPDLVDEDNNGNVAKENNGGVMEWLKKQTIKFLLPILPHKYRKILYQNYDFIIAPWWENLISFFVSSIFFGLPAFIFTGDIDLALKVSYLGTWPILVLGHTPLVAKFFNSRAPPENFRDSVLIALVNIALPFLPFQFPFLIFSFSTIVFLSFATHFIMNLARAMIPNIGFYLKMAFVKNNNLIINAFDVGDYSDLELGTLAKQIKLAYKTGTKIIVPLFTNKDKIDIFKLRRELINQYNLTDEMLGNVCFGGIVVTRKDLLPLQEMDPVKGIEAEALYSALKAKLLELKRLDSELFVQVFTSNESLFKITSNLEKKIRVLLILSSSKVQPLTPIFDQDSRSRKLVETNQ